ncbi:MAG: tetratricopeptide repeat protein [Pseudonocardiales bacterium]|nr:tetratricopeptide repeat protein [Pseudonocardiales bacterium]
MSMAWVFSVQDREDEAVAAAERALVIDPRHSWALRSRIDFLRYGRRFEEAERAAHNAIERRPKDPDVHVSMAWLKSGIGCYEEAVAAAEQALVIDPRHSWALRSRIDFLRYGRRFGEAEQAACDAIERQPDDPDVHVTIAWLKSDLDCYEEAVTATERALAIDLRHSWVLRGRVVFLRYARRFEEAEQAAHNAVERQPNDPDTHVELGRMHDYFLRFDTAVDCFSEALRREPDHTGLNIAKSATLRSLRRFAEAERQITRLFRLWPHLRDLKFEFGWIHHDERRFVEAQRLFEQLLDSAVNDRERAAAHHALGWVAFSEDDYVQAEGQFRMANTECPDDFDYTLAMVWALARQDGDLRLREAERIAVELLERQPSSSVHICLGVLAFKQENLASAEYHLRKALEVDWHHGSYTDLGALYVQMGRYAEAETILKKAIARDRRDTRAHIELGALRLQLGGERTSDAEQEFRQALASDPSSGDAAIGLAQSLSKAGNEVEAESTLRRVLLRQNARQRWRSHLALARLLVQRGDKQQNSELYAEAHGHAQRAIDLAPDAEADPYFVASVAHHRMGLLTADARGRFGFRRRAARHLRECLSRDPGHAEARRNLQLLEREQKTAAPAVLGGYAVAAISFLLLGLMWAMFFFSDKVTALMVTTTTPVLVGMFVIAVLLPALISLKLPGFEAHLQAGVEAISPGPTGQVTFDPGRFTVTAGPSGQLPRRE